ncbi:emerin (Emery-Dreifuss muscular dystrophy) isoform X2 [Stigmatopora nigra]
MMSLSEKTDEELIQLLSKYGIKHGPIVDSTRKLYVKKLEEAMAGQSVTPPSDKTYYREEEEEITYVTYRRPVKHEAYEDMSEQLMFRLTTPSQVVQLPCRLCDTAFIL